MPKGCSFIYLNWILLGFIITLWPMGGGGVSLQGLVYCTKEPKPLRLFPCYYKWGTAVLLLC